MLEENIVAAFMENQGTTLDEMPEDFREELPNQMLLYEWEGAKNNEIKQNA